MSLSFPFPITASGQVFIDHIIQHVIERDRRICQMCGADETCLCPYDRKKISLFVRLIKPSAPVEPFNMRTICSTCAEGLKPSIIASKQRLNAGIVERSRLQLLAQIRRASIDDQKVVLEWLLRKFKCRAVSDEQAGNE